MPGVPHRLGEHTGGGISSVRRGQGASPDRTMRRACEKCHHQGKACHSPTSTCRFLGHDNVDKRAPPCDMFLLVGCRMNPAMFYTLQIGTIISHVISSSKSNIALRDLPVTSTPPTPPFFINSGNYSSRRLLPPKRYASGAIAASLNMGDETGNLRRLACHTGFTHVL